MINFLKLFVSFQDEKFAAITTECAAAHNITPEKVAEIKLIKDKSTIEPTEDLKCFAKCSIDKSGFIEPETGYDVEELIKKGVAHGKEEAKVRATVEKCKPFYTGAKTCEESWSLYTCFFSH